MRERFSTCPPSGTAPAARPVRAPCTVMGTALGCRSRSTARSSSSVRGNEMLSAVPRVRDSSCR